MIRLDEERMAGAVAEAIERRFGSEVRLAAIYLFGSFAKGRQRRGSDVDLGVLPSDRIDPLALYDVAQDVAVAIGRDVHLLDLRAASTVMAATIVGEGRPIAMFDRNEADAFAARTLAEYAYLNEVRQPAMEAFFAPYREPGAAEAERGG